MLAGRVRAHAADSSDSSDPGVELSGQDHQDNDNLTALSSLSHCSRHLDQRSSLVPNHTDSTHTDGPCSADCLDLKMFQLATPRRKPQADLTPLLPLSSGPLFPLDAELDAICADPGSLMCEEELLSQWVTLRGSFCSSRRCLQLPLAPETPQEALSPDARASAESQSEECSSPTAALSSNASTIDDATALNLFCPVASVAVTSLGEGNDNSGRNHARNCTRWSRPSVRANVQDMYAEGHLSLQLDDEDGQEEVCPERRSFMPTPPTLVLRTPSSTSLVLIDPAGNEYCPPSPNHLCGVDNARSVNTVFHRPTGILPSDSLSISSIYSTRQRAGPDHHTLASRTTNSNPRNLSRSTYFRRGRRSATTPVDIGSTSMRKKGKGAEVLQTSIDTLFPQPKHGFGATLGPLLSLSSLRRSLSVGVSGSPKVLGTGHSRSQSPSRSATPQGQDDKYVQSGRESATTPTSSRSRGSDDSSPEQGQQSNHQHAQQ